MAAETENKKQRQKQTKTKWKNNGILNYKTKDW
jgi:hypothetical protein